MWRILINIIILKKHELQIVNWNMLLNYSDVNQISCSLYNILHGFLEKCVPNFSTNKRKYPLGYLYNIIKDNKSKAYN